ncbi:CTP synthetase [Halorubrum ezzemoulense]|uniref:CTP synthetase n=1 Tax=Halorubrum ezzemoulense TaxID=337243 RepID=A0ABT4Z2B1_HALEZ|nr:CTP synthetase [Halorubrum ezzemoulense]MDB2244135.1 CTP synthetase [Halorubrum ezzemoulense]MDB2277871.1 CTP synthetase [Halorubrum ezzemoulense]MDB2284657.1 CTP synthetase [Halorubrum ezzemoulense]MDB2289498.1 CTP synthetase [Halorubrum ezzemoulense]MDB2292294.1 CTP synthetase [Halorubrum ezzemoulense]
MTDQPLAVVAGPDEHGLGEELAACGVAINRIEGLVTADALAEAGIADAAYFVLTDVEEATGIPVAKEKNPEVQIVTYASRSLPEFVATVADLAVGPELLDAATVAEELTGDADDPAEPADDVDGSSEP